jgi:opacity protein-like surface antigen
MAHSVLLAARRYRSSLLLGASLTLAHGAACAPDGVDPSSSGDGFASSGDGDEVGAGDDFSVPDAEACNGFDDDRDGDVDEGCSCAEGTTQPCFPGSPSEANVGVCVTGTQTCTTTQDGEFATSAWGECAGAVGPSAETCGDGVDTDCDGTDPPCSDGAGGGGGGGPCVPTDEVCGNGVDEDCDGADEPCEDILDVTLNLFGDCITASCPSSHPYPVACNVFFTPGDDRGCVANAPGSSVVYFQAGDECSAGFVTGTLSCSTMMGSPLGPSNCPINKPITFYPSDPSGCPEITD